MSNQNEIRRCSKNCMDFQKVGRIFRREYWCTHECENGTAPQQVYPNRICLYSLNPTFSEAIERALRIKPKGIFG